MTPVIAFVSDLWRRRFGWDAESKSTTAPAVAVTVVGPGTTDAKSLYEFLAECDPEALRRALREALDAQPDPLQSRSPKARRP